jgi:hypothetical protein
MYVRKLVPQSRSAFVITWTDCVVEANQASRNDKENYQKITKKGQGPTVGLVGRSPSCSFSLGGMELRGRYTIDRRLELATSTDEAGKVWMEQ